MGYPVDKDEIQPLFQSESRQSLALPETKRPSLLDSVLAQSMNQVSLIFKTEILAGEIRVWQESLKGENPELVKWAFAEYLKTGDFPPKPGDITKLIADRREFLASENRLDYKPLSDEEKAAIEAGFHLKYGSFAEFQKSDEYAAWIAAAKAGR